MSKRFSILLVVLTIVSGLVVLGIFLYKTQWEEYKAKRVVNRILV